jgi:dCTP deaminase
MNGRGEVLPDWRIKELIERELIIGADKSLINSSSLDLRLDVPRWRLLGSFLPLETQNVEEVLGNSDVVDDSNTSKKDFYLEPSQPYLVKLLESLKLPNTVTARMHNKSGRGRIGISTRGLVDKVSRFDNIPAGHNGNLYAEICATTFPIVIDQGTAIPQVRFYNGEPQPLQGFDLDLLLRDHPILTNSKGKLSYNNEERDEVVRTGEFTFHADLSNKLLIYKANRRKKTIVLSKEEEYDPNDFFEEVKRKNSKDKLVIIHPEEFVLVKSMEHIRLPPEVAAEISEYSPELADARTHYAGLINAGHGYDPKNPNVASSIVFEVRARDSPIALQHGQKIAKFEVYRMMDVPKQSYMEVRSTDFSDLKSFLPKSFKKD